MKKLFLLLSLFSAASLAQAQAQTFTGGGGNIPDTNTTIGFPLTVSGLSPGAVNGTFGVRSVSINIAHPYVGDLVVQLRAPDGTTVDLSDNNGGGGANYTNTTFSATAAAPITAGSAPFSGTFKPQGTLGNVNNGQNGNGSWQLRVRDTSPGDAGQVLNWRLDFGTNPAPPATAFASSNLPIVVIKTNGQAIPDEPKIDAYMGIIDHGPGQRNAPTDAYTDYHNKIGIELRGSSSQDFPQKSYSIETRDVNNAEHDTTVLGMPEENAWILYAPYDDKTCMRNVLTYAIANKTGH